MTLLALYTVLFFALLTPAEIIQPTVLSARAGSPASDIKWAGYSKALTSAGKSGKKILVDVYTAWCGWCKKMDRDVYANDEVQAYIQKHFEAVKLDAESKRKHKVAANEYTEREIAKQYGVSSYPTTLFLDHKGEPITAIPGYIKANRFLAVLEYIEGNHYKTTGWNEFLKSRK